MLDIKYIHAHTEEAKRMLGRRGVKPELVEHLAELDSVRRDTITKVGELQSQRNQISAEFGKRRKAGEDTSGIKEQVDEIKQQIAKLEAARVDAEAEIQSIIENLPNFPNDSVPDGLDDTNNRCVRTWGEIKDYDYPLKPHWELGTELGIFDFERSAKLAGTRFWMLLGQGARLERALIAYMLDLHCQHQGYTEVIPPVIANKETMYSTGQLPKFAEDVFHIDTNDMYLISTAEIPLTNMHRGEIIDGSLLPIKYTGFTPCFRSEAGAAGRDTRGLVRVHQFHKVEMVKFSLPETSFDELEKMVNDA
ncbi:serine--tRNA ligase, partial [bacterium]|nr:serine--tRNA ligase [bacterium]